MKKEKILSPNWLNGNYNINGYKVTIDYPHSFACFELNEDETYTFQGDEGNDVIEAINLIFNTYTCDEDAPTKEESIEKWINLNL